MKKLLQSCLAVLIFTSASCTVVDPQFAALEPKIQSSPDADAIVGMWYRKNPGDFTTAKNISSLLFKSDGTGYSRFKMVVGGLLGDEEFLNESNFTWKYAGNGAWDIVTQEGKTMLGAYRTTGRELISYHKSSRTVYTRAE